MTTAARRRAPDWKTLLAAVLVPGLFFVALELLLAAVGVRSVLYEEDPYVGFTSYVPVLGEGLSDWWSLVLSALPSHTPTLPRGIGNYVIFEAENGPRIRNFQYTTDISVNPQTYADIGATNIPHGVGEIYNSMLWEMYWLLVAEEGFDTDFYNGTGGNNTAMQLIIDGMKMTVCSPTFVDARDGILAADLATFGGAHQCSIWRAFAKRGVGVGANGGSPSAVGDEVESFLLPDGAGGLSDCLPIFTDGFESGDTSAWSSSVP